MELSSINDWERGLGTIVIFSSPNDKTVMNGRFRVFTFEVFTDADKCVNYILSINHSPIFFVVRAVYNMDIIVSVAQDLLQVHSIYIYGKYLGDMHPKIFCVTSDEHELSSKLSDETL